MGHHSSRGMVRDEADDPVCDGHWPQQHCRLLYPDPTHPMHLELADAIEKETWPHCLVLPWFLVSPLCLARARDVMLSFQVLC